MQFVWYTLLGLITIAAGLTLIGGGVFGLGWIWGQATSCFTYDGKVAKTGRAIGDGFKYLFTVIAAIIIGGFLLIVFHDAGCALRNHPEHMIMQDSKQPTQHSH